MLPTAAIILTLSLAAIFAAWIAVRQSRRAQRASARTEALRADKLRLERVAERNQTILQHAMDGFFVLDEHGRFVDVNPAFCRMLGYTRAALLEMRIADIERQSPGAFGPATLRTGLHHFPSIHQHRDGHIVRLESSVIVVRDADRKILVGFARDITERVRAEEALRKSEEQYRNVVETSRDLIWAIGPDGRWRFLNGATREIYGCDPDEMIGLPFLDSLAPESRSPLAVEWNALQRDSRAHLLFDATQFRKDGQRVFMTFNAIIKRDANGWPIEMVGTARDITRGRQVEAELLEANARFEAIKSGLPLGYVVWTLDGRVVEWNAAAEAIFGYTTAEALAADVVTLLFAPEFQARFQALRAQLETGLRQFTAMLTNKRRDDAAIVCEWFSTVLRDAEGHAQLVASVVRDVSERERLEAQLQHAQKMESLGVLAGGVAHDFNNLLVGMLGNASLAGEHVDKSSAAHTYLNKIVKAAARATELTRHMLTYAGRAERDVRPLELNALIREMTDFMGATIHKNIALSLNLDPNLPLIAADSGQCQQVIMNLLINAAEACGDQGGQLRMATRALTLTTRTAAEFRFGDQQPSPGEHVCVEVADTGCGMDAETLARIFDPFFTTKFTGRGLGLAAIRGIIKAHNGGIRVKSAPNRGTTFAILFPATAAPAPSESAEEAFEIPAGSTILVIDDEAAIREVVQAVLEQHGATVLVAENGARGVSLFKENSANIDAVLLDLTMPGMGGEAVFRELYRLRPSVPVIVSSGYSEQETVARFREAGLAGFVHKPYSLDTLVNRIGAALQKA